EKGALEQQHAALPQPRRQLEDAGTGIAAIGEGDLVEGLLDLAAVAPQARDLLARQLAQFGAQPLAAPQQVVAERRHDVVDRERSGGEAALELDPLSRREAAHLGAVVDFCEATGGGEELRQRAGDRRGTPDPRRTEPLQATLREHPRNPERMVEVAVSQEEV